MRVIRPRIGGSGGTQARAEDHALAAQVEDPQWRRTHAFAAWREELQGQRDNTSHWRELITFFNS